MLVLLQRVIQAPHRLFFALGSLLTLVAMIWWVLNQIQLVEYQRSLSGLYAPGIHMISMVYGVITQFILGFIFTVFPRWLNYRAIRLLHIRLIFSLFLLGYLICAGALFWGQDWLLAGSVISSLGFVYTALILWRDWFRIHHERKLQPGFALLALTAGALGSLSFCLFAYNGDLFWYLLSYGLGFHFYLSLMVFSVAYRMIPFFTSCIHKDYELRRLSLALPAFAIFSGIKVIAFTMQRTELYLLSDLGLLLIVLAQFRLWRFRFNQGSSLLSMLYYSVAWLPIGFALYSLLGLFTLLGHFSSSVLEEAALHALAIGCYSSLVYAVATRVTLGHSGRPLQANALTYFLFFVLQAVALSRVIMGILGHWDYSIVAKSYLVGIPWLLCFGIWCFQVVPIYFQLRVDGKPG
jgi:uncharacterized protein involved in response to NO